MLVRWGNEKEPGTDDVPGSFAWSVGVSVTPALQQRVQLDELDVVEALG